MKHIIGMVLILSLGAEMIHAQGTQGKWDEEIGAILENTSPLRFPRGDRLPFYLKPAMGVWDLTEKEALDLVYELDKRGIGLQCNWRVENREETLKRALTVAKAQVKAGLEVSINAIDLMYSFYNGDERTAHIDEEGRPFFDDSFGRKEDMGCPFAIDFRKEEIRARFTFYLDAYAREGISIHNIWIDWEVDGPIEVNRAFQHSEKCARCREHLGEDFTFGEFQKTMREMRSYLQFYAFSEPVLKKFPDALAGNYAVYPNDGYRYWYDYFEEYEEPHPYVADQEAKYREWYDDFPLCGFTIAMPVTYTWSPIFDYYDFEETDYRWFYNMLLVASNAGKSTPQNTPIMTFIHWQTIFYPHEPDERIEQMSADSYQELLWHMLLRGNDAFFMWNVQKDFSKDLRIAHEVYAAAQEYGEFLDRGMPITFDIPDEPGTVISGLALGDRVLVRRSDFGNNREAATILAGTHEIRVEFLPGQCQIIEF